jgi:hypothetical protein
MSPATTPQLPRRRTPPSTRAGSAERRNSWEGEMRCSHAWGARSCSWADMAGWASENDEPIAGLMEQVVGALERLECRSAGQHKGTIRDALSVRHASFGRSFPVLGYAFPTEPNLAVHLQYTCLPNVLSVNTSKLSI